MSTRYFWHQQYTLTAAKAIFVSSANTPLEGVRKLTHLRRSIMCTWNRSGSTLLSSPMDARRNYRNIWQMTITSKTFYFDVRVLQGLIWLYYFSSLSVSILFLSTLHFISKHQDMTIQMKTLHNTFTWYHLFFSILQKKNSDIFFKFDFGHISE